MTSDYPPGEGRNKDPAIECLNLLREETVKEAWGDIGPVERRWIVTAAIIFGEEFDHQLSTRPPGSSDHKEAQRMLMDVINASIDEFARRENLSRVEAAEFLSEVETRDLILEFNEVLEARETNPERTLDELLREAVDSRLDKARWADHWTSG